MSDTLDLLTAELAKGLDMNSDRYEKARSEAESSGRVAVLQLLQTLGSRATTLEQIQWFRREAVATMSTWVVGDSDDGGDLAEQGEIGRRLARLLTQLGEAEIGREVALKAFDWLPSAELSWALSSQHPNSEVAATLVEWTYNLSRDPAIRSSAARQLAKSALDANELQAAQEWLERAEQLIPDQSYGEDETDALGEPLMAPNVIDSKEAAADDESARLDSEPAASKVVLAAESSAFVVPEESNVTLTPDVPALEEPSADVEGTQPTVQQQPVSEDAESAVAGKSNDGTTAKPADDYSQATVAASTGSVADAEPGDGKDRAQRIAELREAADSSQDDMGKALALRTLATLLAEDGMTASDVAVVSVQAAELDPSDVSTASTAIRFLLATDELERAARLAERVLESTKGSAHSAAAQVIGECFAEIESHQELAVGALRIALASDKTDAGSVDALVAIHSRAQAWNDAIEVLQSARRATRSRPDERRWLAQEGQLLWKYKDDMLAAERVFRRVRAIDPNNLPAIEFFEEHFERQSDWKRLHATLSQKFALVPQAERLDLAIRMAELAEHRMDKLDKAIEPYKRVLTDDPTNSEASDRLVELYGRTGKWYALVDFLQARVRQLPDDVSGREQKVALLFQIIEIYQDPDKLPVEEMVIQNYKRIVQLSPTNARALDDLAQHYEDAHRWSELVGVLQKKIHLLQAEVDEADDAEVLLDLFHRVAALYIGKMSSESQAVPFLERILEIDPTNLEVVRTLRGIYKSKHNLERLYGTWERELEYLQGEERIGVLTELAVLATDKLYWHTAAIGHWEELLKHDETSEKASASLLQLYAQEELWDRYADLLHSRLDYAQTRRRKVEILEQLGPVQLERLEDLELAKATYRQLQELSPNHRGIVETLKRIYVGLTDWPSLRDLFAGQRDWAGYLQFLDDLIADVDGSVDRRELQLETVRILEEQLSDSAGALARLESLLEQDADDLVVARMLLERYEAEGRVDDLIMMLERLVALVETSDERESYLSKGLQLMEHAERWNDAFEWQKHLADIRVAEGESILESANRLHELALQGECEAALSDWYAESQSQIPSSDERVYLLRRHAELLHQRLRRGQDAIEVYEELSHIVPDDMDVLNALEKLTQSEKDWSAFDRTLTRKFEISMKKAALSEQKVIGMKLARLLEDILDEPERAVKVYRELLDLAPDDDDVFMGLESLLSAEDRWEDILDLRKSRLQRIDSDEGRAQQLTEMARVLVRLEDMGPALDMLDQALRAVPGYEDAVSLTWNLFQHEEHRNRVSDLLEGHFRATEDNARLITLLTERLVHADDINGRRSLLAEIATLREEGLGHLEAAFRLRLEHVALDPSDPGGRQELEQLAEKVDGWPSVASLYSKAIGVSTETAPPEVPEYIEKIEDSEVEAQVTLRLAELYEAQLEQLELSVECYERVLSYTPSSLETLGALERLHARLSDWESLLAAYQARLDLIWEVEDKKALHLDMCQLLRDELSRPEDAIAHYQAYLELDEESLDVIAELEELYAEHERWDDLIGLLRRRLSLAKIPGERVEVLMRMAALHRTHLDDLHQTFEAYAGVLAIDPEHEGAVDALEGLLSEDDHLNWPSLVPRLADTLQPWFSKHGQWQREAGVLIARHKVASDDESRAANIYAIGQLYEGPGRSVEDAFGAYCDAIRIYPALSDVANALERTARALSRFETWADILDEAAHTGEPDIAIPLLLKLGDISRVPLDDSERAISAYERIIDLQPLHPIALESLDALYDLTDQADKRVEVLEKYAEIAEDDSSRRINRFEAGVLYVELERIDDAIDCFAYVAEHGDPAHETLSSDALDRLIALYEEADHFEELTAALVRKGDYVQDDERRTYLLRAAALSENVLHDMGRAIDLYEAARSNDLDDGFAQENLERLLRQEERYADVEDLLLELRAKVEGEAATALDLRLGKLYDGLLRRRSDAIDRYEAILDRDPAHEVALAALQHDSDDELALRSARILERAYEATESYQLLAAVLERQIEDLSELINVAATHRRLAGVMEEHLQDLDSALEHRCHAARLEWSHDDPQRAALVRLAKLTENWERLEATDRAALTTALDHQRRLLILSEMARVATDEMQSADNAERILRETLNEAPGDANTLEALRELYEVEGRFVPMVEILREQAENAEGADRTAILFTIAAVLRDHLDDPAGAARVYEQLIADEPTEAGPWDALEAIFRADEEYESIIGLLERRAEQAGSEEARFSILERRLRILSGELDDRGRALDAGSVLLGLKSNCAAAVELLEACRTDRFEYDRVVRQLIPVYESRQDWDALQVLYEEYAEESDNVGRIWAYEALHSLYTTIRQDDVAAYEATAALTRCEPTSLVRWVALEKVASQLGRYAEVVDLYGDLIDEGRAGVNLALRAAGVCETQLEEPTLAADFYERVVELEPEHGPAQEALERIYIATESWDDLVVLYERKFHESKSDGERLEVLGRLLDVHQQRRQDALAVTEVLTRRLELTPGDRPTFEALLNAHRMAGRHSDMEDLYRQWFNTSVAMADIETHLEFAAFLVEPRGHIGDAIDVIISVLDDHSAHPSAIALLVKIFEESSEHAVQVAEILDQHYDDSTSFEARENVLQTLALHANQQEDETRSLTLHRRLGSLYRDEANDAQAAFGAYAIAVRLAPEDQLLRAELRSIAQEADLHLQFDACLSEVLEGEVGDEHRLDILKELATIEADQLGQAARSAERYESILDIYPSDKGALDALEVFYDGEGSSQDLIRILRAKLDICDGPNETVVLLMRLGEMAISIGDTDAAIVYYRDSLDADPTLPEPKRQLVVLYRDDENWEELVSVLRMQLDEAEDPDRIIELFTEIAEIQERKIQSVEDAIETFREVLGRAPANVYALTSLERLLPSLEDWDGLLSVYEAKKKLFADPRARAKVDFLIGQLLYDKLDHPERALETFRLVLVTDEAHAETAAYLERMLDEPSLRLAASFALEPVYEATQNDIGLSQLIEVQIEEASDDAERFDLFRRLASIRLDALSDGEGALEALRDALLLRPADEEVRSQMSVIAELHKLPAEYADALEAAQGVTTDDAVIISTNRALGALYEHQLNNHELAIERWRDVLAYDPTQGDALEALERLLTHESRWDELVDILRQELSSTSGDRSRAVRMQLGNVLLDRLSQSEEALDVFRTMAVENPDDPDAHLALTRIAQEHPTLRDEVQRVLQPLYQTAERWSDLVNLLLDGLSAQEPVDDTVRVHLQVADIYGAHLADHEQAYVHYRMALVAAPERTDILNRIEPLAMQAKRFDDLDELYVLAAKSAEDDATCRDLLKRAGRLALECSDDAARAELRFKEVVRLFPDDYDVLTALEDIYEIEDRVGELIEVCEAKIALPLDEDERIGLHRKVAKASQTQNEVDKTVHHWDAIVQLDPTDSEALEALNTLYSLEGRPADRAQIIEYRALAEGDAEVAVGLRIELARLRAGALDDANGAIETLEEALSVQPQNQDALSLLDSLYAETEDWSGLARTLERRLETSSQGAGRLGLLTRLAELEATKLERWAAATVRFEEVLASRPLDDRVLLRLSELYEMTEQWGRYVEIIQTRAGLTESAQGYAALMMAAANITERHIEDPAAALDFTGKILERSPEHIGALRFRARLLSRSPDKNEEALEAWETLSPKLSKPSERVEAFMMMGRLHRACKNSARALTAFQETLALQP
ncbi:MAG: hypothetical protein VX223_17330, partial [Myxococcota bacterium]|nr:hypothetical protein [Myxococcota bacterium]